MSLHNYIYIISIVYEYSKKLLKKIEFLAKYLIKLIWFKVYLEF